MTSQECSYKLFASDTGSIQTKKHSIPKFESWQRQRCRIYYRATRQPHKKIGRLSVTSTRSPSARSGKGPTTSSRTIILFAFLGAEQPFFHCFLLSRESIIGNPVCLNRLPKTRYPEPGMPKRLSKTRYLEPGIWKITTYFWKIPGSRYRQSSKFVVYCACQRDQKSLCPRYAQTVFPSDENTVHALLQLQLIYN